MKGRRPRRLAGSSVLGLAAALMILGAPPVGAQTVQGTAFEDRDGDGIHDAGEPVLAGVAVDLFGEPTVGGSVDQTVATDLAGDFSFSPGLGCYVLRLREPAGWRLSQTREDSFLDPDPGFPFPIGRPRWSKLAQAIDHLKSGDLDYASMGDSIAWNWNSCTFPEPFWYSKEVRDRLRCAAPAASVSLLGGGVAIKGEHTDDLLVDDNDDLNNVFRIIELQPELISLSMIGNDLLGVDPGSNPTQQEINVAAAEVLDARQNLQEALSVMTSEVPEADLALSTLYDNEAWDCYTGAPSDFHREWLPLVNRILRDLAWGQTRRVSIVEVAADFAKEDQQGNCSGFDRMICRDLFQTDNIHPNDDGFTVIREKLSESAGAMLLGPQDALNRTSIVDADYGLLRRVRRLLPTTWETRNGASVTSAPAATDDQDGGAAASITLGSGSEEFRLAGFPDWFDEVQIVRVRAGVRYRTTGTVADDFYRMEASVSGQFRPPPSYDYTTTNWNFYTPIVGGGGPNKPDEDPDYGNAHLLALPDVPAYRDVSATLTKNPVLPPGAADYEWPAVTHEELATTAVRVAAAPVASTPGNDGYQVELDAAWLDLYGWEKARPGEVTGLRVDRLADGTLEVSFDPVTAAQRYNVYHGRLATVRGGSYDHGAGAPAGPDCDATTQAAGGGRLKVAVPPADQPAEDAYLLVTAHVDDVESAAGRRSTGVEIDRSQSTCR